jgi:hypothetical protein
VTAEVGVKGTVELEMKAEHCLGRDSDNDQSKSNRQQKWQSQGGMEELEKERK